MARGTIPRFDKKKPAKKVEKEEPKEKDIILDGRDLDFSPAE